jgi:predicted membrane protein
MIQDSQSSHEWYSAQRLVPALLLIAVGAIFLLNNFHVMRAQDLWQYWPVILMVAGVFKLVDAEDAPQRTGGGILLAFGSIILASNLGLIPVNVWDLWPVLLIGAGIYMLVDRTMRPRVFVDLRMRGRKHCRDSRNWTRHETAVFSGGNRKVSVDNFQSAKYDAVFGGFEIDLRGSKIQGDSAELEINAVLGGAEVRVPRDWSVVMEGAGVFGGFADSTEQPDPSVMPNPKRLYVRGAAVFGGVEIKN